LTFKIFDPDRSKRIKNGKWISKVGWSNLLGNWFDERIVRWKY
jgi:hypothetical protein